MQLLIILVLLLYGGGNAKNILGEVKPVLESLGGEDMQKALKSAEEISEVLSVIQPIAGGLNTQNNFNKPQNTQSEFPLAPVMEIADKEITYSLSQYIAQA